MLKTVWLQEKSNKKTDGCTVLLGGFDGLHIGHRQLVEEAKSLRKPIGVMTIIGGKADEGLFTLLEREEIFRLAGVDFVFAFSFSDIKDLSAQAFASLLQENLQASAYICGDDFRFGAGAKGTPEILENATHVRVETVKLLTVDGEKVSSGRVKKLLLEGDLERANLLLGERFFLTGEVVADRKIGRTIGFPTANIRYPEGKFSIKKGVYETRVCVDGKEYKGITNFGARPTFDEPTELTETYLDGFSGDLYGRKIKVEFVRFLREIVKFESVEKLKEQLREDTRRIREND
ncbi:MAG: riboflavin biosynthesis protein RibF [Clostridia bacterium]|nr:riboflavin biosynthesis protein RibF [Clostridia bacterium]